MRDPAEIPRDGRKRRHILGRRNNSDRAAAYKGFGPMDRYSDSDRAEY